jgi:hypothetical protein
MDGVACQLSLPHATGAQRFTQLYNARFLAVLPTTERDIDIGQRSTPAAWQLATHIQAAVGSPYNNIQAAATTLHTKL